MELSPVPLLLLPALLLALLARPAAAAYGPSSLLLLRVGDGVACPSRATACVATSPLHLDEIDIDSGALLSSVAIVGATLSGGDPYLGALTPCGSGSCVVFGAQADAPGTLPLSFAAPPSFAGSRVVVRVNAAGAVDTTTLLPAAAYDGVLKGVCSLDGSGFWLTGNSSSGCVSYVEFGGSTNTVVASGALCANPTNGAMDGHYTGCLAVATPAPALYFARLWASTTDFFGFIDQPAPNTQSAAWTTANAMTLLGVSADELAWNQPEYFSQLLLNRAGDKFWALDPRMGSIAFGSTSAAPELSGWRWIFLGGMGPISGMALSPDEQRLFVTFGGDLYWMAATALSPNVPTWLYSSPPYFEFRGVAFAPQPPNCSSSGSGPQAGWICPGGAGTAFVSSSLGCSPTMTSDGPVDSLAFAFSGSAVEGVAAFSTASSTAGLSFTTDRFNAANAALTVPYGVHLDSSTGMALPTGNAAMSLSAFVRCAPFTSTPQASVFEWGHPAVASSTSKLSLSVLGSGNASVPGPIAGVCEGRWHHIAVVQGDGSATTMQQYVDGALVASSSSTTLAVPATGNSLRVGWNGAPETAVFTAVGSTSWTVPDGVTSVNVLVLAGGGGGGGAGDFAAGGGGAGGFLCLSSVTVTPGEVIALTVGHGGAGGDAISLDTSFGGAGSNGGDSLFGALRAVGGGGGGGYGVSGARPATPGGSGGGQGVSDLNREVTVGAAGTADQGFPGGWSYRPFDNSGYSTGGGGGAGGRGGNAVPGFRGSPGGFGARCPEVGLSTFLAGGGGGTGTIGDAWGVGGLGGGGQASSHGFAGLPGTGSGGGGSSSNAGGAGGSGLVIVSWAAPTGAAAHEVQDLFAGSISDLRLYSRALVASEVLALSQPPLNYEGAVNPEPLVGAAIYATFMCERGFFGTADLTWMKDASSGAWASSGSISCAACPLGITNAAPGSASVASCLMCAAGYEGAVTNGGTPSAAGCTICGAGSAAAAGASVCASCLPGTWSAAGAAVCQPCKAGFASAAARAPSASSCMACGKGSYSAAGAATCSSCPEGTFSASVQATSRATCLPCPPGTSSGSIGAGSASACIPCAVDSFAPAGSSTCLRCSPGSSSSAGASSCESCGVGSYSASGVCTSCGPGTASSARGAVSPSTCAPCSGLTYSYGGSACAPCPPLAAFLSPSAGCAPSSALFAGPASTAFYLSGSITEGTTALVCERDGNTSSSLPCSSLSFVRGPFGGSGSALAAVRNVSLTANGSAAPTSLPSGGGNYSLTAWVTCDPSQAPASVLAWGSREPLGSDAAAALVVGPGAYSGEVTSLPSGSDDFDGPVGVVALPGGGLVVSDLVGNRLFVVSPSGVITPLAGSGVAGNADGVGSAASFSFPFGIALLPSGDAVVVADSANNLLRIVSLPQGVVTTLCGSGQAAFADGTAEAASFDMPAGVAVLSTGDIVVSDANNNRLRLVTPLGNVSTLVGNGSPALADGAGTSAALFNPRGLAVMPGSDMIVVADNGNQRIRLVTPAGAVSTLAGGLEAPGAVAFVPSTGLIIVSDLQSDDYSLRVVSPSGLMRTLAGTTVGGYADGPSAAASFKRVLGLAVDESGRILVADYENARIRFLTPIAPGELAACDSTWHHVALTYAPAAWPGPSLLAFVDGALVLQQAAALSLPQAAASTLRVGGGCFAGALAELRVYNRSLSAPEVVALSQPRLVAYANASVAPSSPRASATTYTYSCRAGFFGPVVELVRSPVDGVWASVPAGVAVSCAPCPAGTSSFLADSTWCAPCLSGTWAQDAGSANCSGSPCPPGTSGGPPGAKDPSSAASCQLCAPGLWSSSFGASICQGHACGAGFAGPAGAESEAAAVCVPVPAPAFFATPAGSAVIAAIVMSVVLVMVTVAVAYLRRMSARLKLTAAVAEAATGFGAVNVLVTAINKSRRRSGVLSDVASVNTRADDLATLRFSDLVPDLSVPPLFGGFGVVLCAHWVSRGIRVAVKVPKDLIVSGYLAPAAAAELVKEAQGLVRASDGNVNEFVVRLFGVAQGDGGAAWAAACYRARELYFARKGGASAVAAKDAALLAPAADRLHLSASAPPVSAPVSASAPLLSTPASHVSAHVSASAPPLSNSSVAEWGRAVTNDQVAVPTSAASLVTAVCATAPPVSAPTSAAFSATSTSLFISAPPASAPPVSASDAAGTAAASGVNGGSGESGERWWAFNASTARSSASSGQESAASSTTTEASISLLGLVMAFESGGTLADALRPPPYSLRVPWPSLVGDKVRLSRELAVALFHLHRVGIVHGDLKLENVLLTGSAERSVRLADFGLAEFKSRAEAAAQQSRVSTAHHTDIKRGTWPYMAPEMFASPSSRAVAANRGTDVYALGTLLYELFTGLAPWSELMHSPDPSAARLAKVRAGETLDMSKLPAGTPLAVCALIKDCLALDRTKRPRMARVRAVLEQARDEFVGGRFDVFLSHCWGRNAARKPLTDAIYFALKEHGLRVWLDSNEMGHDLQASMTSGVASSDVVLALLSPDYQRSKACMFELRLAAGLDSIETAQRDAVHAAVDAAVAAVAEAGSRTVNAEARAARESAEARALVARKQRSLATTKAAGDADAIDLVSTALEQARANVNRIDAAGTERVAAAHAAAEAAAAAVRAAEAELARCLSVASAVLDGATSLAPLSALPEPERRKPLVVCVVERGLGSLWQASDELKSLARLSSHLYADASAAASVDWAAEAGVPEADRRKLTHEPKALPRLLELIAEARGRSGAPGGRSQRPKSTATFLAPASGSGRGLGLRPSPTA